MTPADKPVPFDFRRALTENTDQVVFEYHLASNHFNYLNPAFERVFGQGLDTTAAALWQAVHPEDQAYVSDAYGQLLEGLFKKDIEFRIQLPGQTERWISLTPFLGEDAGQRSVYGFARDVTVRRQYADNLTRYSNKKNAVLQILAHDLAGPLATIGGLSKVLAGRLKPYENAEMNKIVALIAQTSQRNVVLIQEFINQEFLESAGVALLKERVDLVAKVREVVDQYRESEQDLGKTFGLDSAPSLYVDIDENKFIQVITNLLSNAVKFTPDGGTITVRLEEREENVLITVEDNGIGIAEKYHAGLFDKFTKARRPGIRGEPSVGLGMSIIKTIVEWHEGKIWFESVENQGTTFFIEIPRGGGSAEES